MTSSPRFYIDLLRRHNTIHSFSKRAYLEGPTWGTCAEILFGYCWPRLIRWQAADSLTMEAVPRIAVFR